MKEFKAILKNELIKTIKRPRSYIGFLVVAIICFMLQAAFKSDGKEIIGFVTSSLESTLEFQGTEVMNGNLICFILLQTLILQMPLLIALITGDLVSGELSDGTIRFLLARNPNRTKIILAKWCAGIIYTLFLLIWLGVIALFVSRFIFGTGDLIHIDSENMNVIREHDVLWRFGGAFIIAFLALSVVASLAHLLSCILDNSITPIVSTMAIIIIFTIIGMFDFPVFDPIKPFLFTTHMISWKEFFLDPVPYNSITLSAIILIVHIVIFLGASIYIFNRKNITN